MRIPVSWGSKAVKRIATSYTTSKGIVGVRHGWNQSTECVPEPS